MTRYKFIGCMLSCALHAAVLTVWALQPPVGKPAARYGSEPRALEVRLLPGDRYDWTLQAATKQTTANIVSITERDLAAPAALYVSEPRPIGLQENVAGNASEQITALTAPSTSDSDYQQRLLAHIRPYLHYPDEDRERRPEGVVRIGFVLQRNGTVLEVWVESSSGYASLDAAALDSVRHAQPLPPVPSRMPDWVNVILPVGFSAPSADRG